MSEWHECPNCGEDCILIDDLTKREREGVLSHDFNCPHCNHKIEARGESFVAWSLTEAK